MATLDGWQRVTVAIGLGLFGVFSMVQAVYRRITNPRVLERAHGRVARSSALGLRARPR